VSRASKAVAEEVAPALGSAEAWRKLLAGIGVNVASIEAALAAYGVAHPEASGAVELARRLLVDALGSDSINAIAEQAAAALAEAVKTGHGKVDKETHPTDMA